jgi:tetratricopeptide (TPR) repeat protein
VFRALDPGLDRDVAIKWSHQTIASETRDLLAREGKVLAQLDLPGIVRVFDLDVHEGRPFLVMEYVRGCNLRQFAAREGVAVADAVRLVAQLARTLAAAHARGIIHQDIKPGNILMDEAGRPRMADFGLARHRGLWSEPDDHQPSGGTLDYMAPEQLAEPERLSPASDLHGLTGVLFFLLTGQAPRRLPDNPALAQEQVRGGEINWALLEGKRIPQRLADICRKGLAVDPARRYQKASDLAVDLEQFLRKRRGLRVLAAGLAAAAAVWALVHFWPKAPEPRLPSDPDPINALHYLRLDIIRHQKQLTPRSPADLERLLPLHEGDKLRLHGRIPEGMHIAIFAVTLTDDRPRVQQLGPLQRRGDRFRVPRLFPLQGAPATEVIFICGAPDRAPELKDVSALLAELRGPSRGSEERESLLLGDVLLYFQSDHVEDPFTDRMRPAGDDSRARQRARAPGNPNEAHVGPGRPDPRERVVGLLEQIRWRLREKYAFACGLAFTHLPAGPNGQAQRTEADPTRKVPGPRAWGGAPDEQRLFQEVMDRLLATDRVRRNYPPSFVWPPRVYIQPNSRNLYNAFAGPHARDPASGNLLVRAFITEGYLSKIVRDDHGDLNADILAAIMGHELAHITRGHLLKKIVRDLPGLALSREQEIEADLEGVKIAVAAGFPYRGGVRAAFREWQTLGDHSNFEGIKGTHPSWAERGARLDQPHARIWQAMAAFQNGYFFLQAEQCATAETCFLTVVREFPDCAQAWANLGYARLMQYCDGQGADDLRKYGLGHLVAGCCYARPEGLTPLRGDEKMWRQAVEALEKALERDPHLAMAWANLGLAYLVPPDGEKQTEQALDYFRRAQGKKDKGLDRLNLAAFLINYGVAELHRGHARSAGEKFRRARKLLPPQGPPLRGQLEQALLYNEALLAADGADPEGKTIALRNLEQYLVRTSPDSTWWPLALDRYHQLGKELKRPPLSRETLARSFGGRLMRVVGSVEAVPGKFITLGDRTAKAFNLLGREPYAGVPIYRNARIKRYVDAAPGIDLLAGDRVLAVFITSERAPPVWVQARGIGSKKHALRVGMTIDKLLAILNDQPAEERSIDNPESKYIFLPDLGLGVQVTGDRVRQIAVVQVPRKGGF